MLRAPSFIKRAARLVVCALACADAMFAANPEVIVDNAGAGASIAGSWTASTFYAGYYGTNYIHDGNTGKGSKSVRFTPNLPSAGIYQVYTRWNSDSGRATNVPIDVAVAGDFATVSANQQANGNTWVLLGAWPFFAGSAGNVLIRNTGTNGTVIADAARFVRVADFSQVSLSAVTAQTTEGMDPFGRFRVSRTGDLSAPLLVKLAVGGTATAGVDYAALPASIALPAGVASRFIDVQSLRDTSQEATESVTVSLLPGGYDLGAQASATIQILDNSFDNWRVRRFSPGQLLDAAVSGARADPDGNGLSNLLEFALGGDASLPLGVMSPEAAFTAGTSSSLFQLFAWRRRELGNYILAPEFSSDLENWNESAVPGQQIDYDSISDRVRLRFDLPVAADSPRNFARVVVRPPGPAPISITVDTADVIRTDISRATFGSGVEFANPQFRTLMATPTAARNAIRNLNMGTFRFPHGTPALYYYWNIPQKSYIEASFVESDIITPDQASGFVDPTAVNSLNMEMLFEVNTFQYKAPDYSIKRVSSTSGANKYVIEPTNLGLAAQSAAAWVGDNLHNKPASNRVTYWEVGNEDWVYWTPAEYVRIFNAFAGPMRLANPDIKILAQSYTGTIAIVGGGTNDRGWTDGLIQGGIDTGKVYALSEHQYLPGGVFTTGTYNDQRIQQTLNMSAQVAKGERIDFLNAKLAEHGLDWKIWMTEFNASPKGPTGAVSRLQDLGHGLVIADWVGKMLEQGVERMFMHSLDHNPYYSIVNYLNDGSSAAAPRVTVPGYAYGMYAQQFGPVMVRSGISANNPLLNSRDYGTFPQVAAYSSIREEDDTLRMFIINRSPTDSALIRIVPEGRAISGTQMIKRQQLYSFLVSDSNISATDYVKWSAPVELPGNSEAAERMVVPEHSVTFLIIPLE